jgi:hypothetical protein
MRCDARRYPKGDPRGDAEKEGKGKKRKED